MILRKSLWWCQLIVLTGGGDCAAEERTGLAVNITGGSVQHHSHHRPDLRPHPPSPRPRPSTVITSPTFSCCQDRNSSHISVVYLNKLGKKFTNKCNVSGIQLRVETNSATATRTISSKMEVKKLETSSLTDRQKELLVAFQRCDISYFKYLFTKYLQRVWRECPGVTQSSRPRQHHRRAH